SWFNPRWLGGGRRKRRPYRWQGRSFLLPVAGALDRLLPLGAADRPLLVGPFWFPGAVHLPVLSQLVEAGPEANRQPGGVRGAQGRGLADRGPYDGGSQDVRLELHQEVVLDHPAVDLEGLDVDARVGLHR